MVVQVKICGLTNLYDALYAAQAGADMLGFIFTSKSVRYVPPEQAAGFVESIKRECSANGIIAPKLVGVFVDEDPDVVERTLHAVGLDYAQLHGSESPEVVGRFFGRAFKAIRPRPGEDATAVSEALTYASLGVPGGPRLLVDSYSPDAYGGTGQLSDWMVAAELASDVAGFVLAGGLNTNNIRTAIDVVQPWGVDVSSGVEARPGRKDHDAIRRLIAAAHGHSGQAGGGQ